MEALPLVTAPQGELPLSAIHINLEEKEKQIRSFLIEGHLINTIRVACASYEDYSHWLLCLRAVSRRDGAPLLSGPEGVLGPLGPVQVRSQQGPCSQVLDSGESQRQRVEPDMGKVGRGIEAAGSRPPARVTGWPTSQGWPRLTLLILHEPPTFTSHTPPPRAWCCPA